LTFCPYCAPYNASEYVFASLQGWASYDERVRFCSELAEPMHVVPLVGRRAAGDTGRLSPSDNAEFICQTPILQVDIFSCGVTTFELFHPFSTGMERVITLRELRESGAPPPEFAAAHLQASARLRHLCSSPTVSLTAESKPNATQFECCVPEYVC